MSRSRACRCARRQRARPRNWSRTCSRTRRPASSPIPSPTRSPTARARSAGRADDIARHTDALLDRFGLASLGRANPFTLSGGQKRRLSVAASLVLGPRALLLDEPTFGQDLVSAHALMDEIAGLCAHGLAVVIATHDLGLVADIADRVDRPRRWPGRLRRPAARAVARSFRCWRRSARSSRRWCDCSPPLGARGAQVPDALTWRAIAAAHVPEAVA